METLTILAWIGCSFLVSFLIWALLIEPWLNRKKDLKRLTKREKPLYHKFEYTGYIYIEGKTKFEAVQTWQKFIKDQRSYAALFKKVEKARSGKN